MNRIEIINKKRLGLELTKEELKYFFNGYLKEEISDYQMSALLMAICINGMNEEEIFELTDLFINSGDKLDLSSLEPCVDKHSTGGVGDKLTLIIGPIVASLGINMAKMSGRALGHTGGTIDKLESFPGIRLDLTEEEFINNTKKVGFAVTGQTGNLTPLDKKVYALRDITGTVDSIPLIASSIMSKKIASGSTKILIDIKVGNGALIKNMEDAEYLANLMIKIGEKYNRKVVCALSHMNIPLGSNIGNTLEVLEVVDILKNNKLGPLTNFAIELASILVTMVKSIPLSESKDLVVEVLENGKAYDKFKEFIINQGGKFDKLKLSSHKKNIISTQSGYITDIYAKKLGEISMELGAGRVDKYSKIDYSAGIVLHKQVGDYIEEGETLCTLYGKYNTIADDIENYFKISLEEKKVESILIKIIK